MHSRCQRLCDRKLLVELKECDDLRFLTVGIMTTLAWPLSVWRSLALPDEMHDECWNVFAYLTKRRQFDSDEKSDEL